MRKHRDARIVTFKQDYKPGGVLVGELSGNPMVKGSTHAMHVDVAEQLRKNGVKIEIEKPDFDKMHAEIKERQRKAV